MTRRRLLFLAGVLAFLALAPELGAAATAAPQLAQLGPNGAPGIVSAQAFGEVPAGRPVAVTPYSDDELSRSVKARFEAALRNTGRAVDDLAALTLSFETKIIEGRFGQTEGNLGRFEADEGGAQLNLNIWSSSQDSLLGGRQQAGAPSRKVNLMHMNLVLRDRRTGKTLWQGDAYCEMLTANRLRIAGSMVAPLIASLGRSVKGQPFDIE